jgi:hypothetical protein
VEVKGIANVMLLFCRLGLTNVREKTGMGSAALNVVPAGFVERELAVDGEAHFRGVGVFLAVVLPPANRAQPQGAGRIQCFVAAARAAIAHFDSSTHNRMDGEAADGITEAAFTYYGGSPIHVVFLVRAVWIFLEERATWQHLYSSTPIGEPL